MGNLMGTLGGIVGCIMGGKPGKPGANQGKSGKPGIEVDQNMSHFEHDRCKVGAV